MPDSSSPSQDRIVIHDPEGKPFIDLPPVSEWPSHHKKPRIELTPENSPGFFETLSGMLTHYETLVGEKPAQEIPKLYLVDSKTANARYNPREKSITFTTAFFRRFEQGTQPSESIASELGHELGHADGGFNRRTFLGMLHTIPISLIVATTMGAWDGYIKNKITQREAQGREFSDLRKMALRMAPTPLLMTLVAYVGLHTVRGPEEIHADRVSRLLAGTDPFITKHEIALANQNGGQRMTEYIPDLLGHPSHTARIRQAENERDLVESKRAAFLTALRLKSSSPSPNERII